MNKKDTLTLLSELNFLLALPKDGIHKASNALINSAWDELLSRQYPIKEHPRLALLRFQVEELKIDDEYRRSLINSIERYGDQIIDRPIYGKDEGWDDLEALQQVTLSDLSEAALSSIHNANWGRC